MILISVKISPFSQSLVQSDCATCQHKEVRGGCTRVEENTNNSEKYNKKTQRSYDGYKIDLQKNDTAY